MYKYTQYMKIRIEKYLSEQGIMSRREAKKYLLNGDIKINGKISNTGDKIDPNNDIIYYSKNINEVLSNKITVAVYKPRGIISSKDTDKGKNIFDVFPQFSELNTVGRLDKESEGLILLSNDGMITKAITGKEHKIEKEYIVTVREQFLPWMAKKMSKGIKLEDGWTLPSKTRRVDTHKFKIILNEGRKHQIRRMANDCKLTVTSLKRIRIHNIKITGMLPGNFRKLTNKEIIELRKHSKKTA